GELRAELDAFTERGLSAAERALRGDLDRSFALGDGRAGRHRGERQNDEDTNDRASDGIPHRQPLLVGVRSSSARHDGLRRHYSDRRWVVVKLRALSISSRNRRVAACGSAAAHTAEMTATPAAPARMAWGTLSWVMPPIPISGARISGRSFATSCGPTSSKSGFVPV